LKKEKYKDGEKRRKKREKLLSFYLRLPFAINIYEKLIHTDLCDIIAANHGSAAGITMISHACSYPELEIETD